MAQKRSKKLGFSAGTQLRHPGTTEAPQLDLALDRFSAGLSKLAVLELAQDRPRDRSGEIFQDRPLCQVCFFLGFFLSTILFLSLSRSTLMYIMYIYIYSIITFFWFNCFGPGNLSWMLCWQLILLEFQELSLMLGPGSFWPQEFQKCVKESLGRFWDILHWDVSKKFGLPLICFPIRAGCTTWYHLLVI